MSAAAYLSLVFCTETSGISCGGRGRPSQEEVKSFSTPSCQQSFLLNSHQRCTLVHGDKALFVRKLHLKTIVKLAHALELLREAEISAAGFKRWRGGSDPAHSLSSSLLLSPCVFLMDSECLFACLWRINIHLYFFIFLFTEAT